MGRIIRPYRGADNPALELAVRQERDFGRKNLQQNTKSKGKMMELGHGNAKGGRSTSLVVDLWIKTYQNAPKSQIDPKASMAIFCVEIFEIRQEKFVGG